MSCIHFQGAISSTGYGSAKRGGVYKSAHVWAYIDAYGPVPDGMIVGHTCHDRDDSCGGGASCLHRRCVNIEHLQAMTPSENTRAALRNIYRGGRTTGHVRSERCQSGKHLLSETERFDGGGSRYCHECKLERNREWRQRPENRERQREASRRARAKSRAGSGSAG